MTAALAEATSGPSASPAAAALWTLFAGLALGLSLHLLLRARQREPAEEEIDAHRRDNSPPPPSSPSEEQQMAHIKLNFKRLPPTEMQKRAKQFYEEMNLRRSVRNFSSEPVPDGVLEDVIRVSEIVGSKGTRRNTKR
jgi:uncharacterized protein HemX